MPQNICRWHHEFRGALDLVVSAIKNRKLDLKRMGAYGFRQVRFLHRVALKDALRSDITRKACGRGQQQEAGKAQRTRKRREATTEVGRENSRKGQELRRHRTLSQCHIFIIYICFATS
jgi:hypothetical protein